MPTVMTFDHIRERLATATVSLAPAGKMTLTAVALVIRRGQEGPELLFIERATHEDDPWSGNIGFPGGKQENNDADLRQTAERETLEELGLDLQRAEAVGRLSDIVGAHLPVRVTCFVYILHDLPHLTLNGEIRDVFWVPLALLCEEARQVSAEVRFAGEALQAPAILLPHAEKPVLWGITFRLVRQFLEILGCPIP